MEEKNRREAVVNIDLADATDRAARMLKARGERRVVWGEGWEGYVWGCAGGGGEMSSVWRWLGSESSVV